MIEIRWHGRGGQGAWTASNILAMAAIKEGKHIQSFPAFGPERMGAPIVAFTRISEEPIEVHSGIYKPDIVVVLDPTLLVSVPVAEGLKEGGKIIVNWGEDKKKLLELLKIDRKYKMFAVPATEIAVRILGRGITNTAMIGALIRAEPLISLDNVLETIKERFKGEIAEKNIQVVKEAYERTEVVE